MDADHGDLADLSTADLEQRMSSLAARIAAAECEFLALLAEFDAREGWGESGMKSSAAWLSWRTGMRPGVARERVRVARSLLALPVVRNAFAAGRLSYCKVRALTRVVTPPVEADLVEIAMGATGAQLERIVRAWRTSLVAETSATTHLRRGLRRRQEEDGSVVYTLRVAPEEAGLVDSAMAAARAVVRDDEGRPIETPEEGALAALLTTDGPTERSDADAFVLMAESFLATGATGDAGDRTAVVVHTDLATLVSALDAGAAPEQVDAAEVLETAGPTAQPAQSTPGVSVHQRSLAGRPPGPVLDSGHRLAPSTLLRMLCASPARLMVHARDGRPLDLGRTRRHASRKQRLALQVRDAGCRFPGCTQRHRLIPHHVAWWTRQGRTDMDNLVLLCPTHHRAVHEVGYTVEALGEGCFAFYRPDGRLLPAAHADLADRSESLTRARVRPDAIVPTWGGERLDLELMIGGLASNLVTAAGYRLPEIRYADLDATLRRAAGWPEPEPEPAPTPTPRTVRAA